MNRVQPEVRLARSVAIALGLALGEQPFRACERRGIR